ncbi:MAG: aminopeptidase [Phycisphaerales bacterium]
MRTQQLSSLAQIIVQHCTPLRPGDLVTIVADPCAMPAVEAVFTAALHARAHPSFHAKPHALQHLLLTLANPEQLTHISPFEQHRLQHCDVLIVLNTRPDGPPDPVDPARTAAHQAARRPLLSMSLDRLARGDSRYCLVELASPASARAAGMTLDEYTDWTFRAGLLHLPDPLAAWRTLHEQHLRMKAFLEQRSTLRFRAPAITGPYPCGETDLTADIHARTWLSRAGGENFPDGELDGGPRSLHGTACFPYAIYRDTLVENIRLRFTDGRVTDASAAANEEFLFRMLDMDAGSRTAGEIALGTNYHITQLTRNTFFDEKVGGTFHLALGAGYPQTGNTNESGLHWDMVRDLRQGGEVTADGEVIQREGMFTPPGWPRP